MAGSVNKVILIGNLGADPEVKSFQNGGKICNLRIATSDARLPVALVPIVGEASSGCGCE